MFQLLVARLCGAGTRDEHDPQAAANRVLMLADGLPQPPPDAIADDCVADSLRRDEPGAESVGAVDLQNTKDEERTAMCGALILHPQELS